VPDKKPTNRSDYSLASKAWNIGLAIVILTLLGHWLDQVLHFSAVFTIIGAFLGIVYSLYEAWAALK